MAGEGIDTSNRDFQSHAYKTGYGRKHGYEIVPIGVERQQREAAVAESVGLKLVEEVVIYSE